MKTLLVIAISLAARAASAGACVDPVNTNQLPATLSSGPHLAGKRTIALDSTIVVGGLTLHVSKRFMPDVMGGKSGTWFTDLDAKVGEKSEMTTVPGTLRIGGYKINASVAGKVFALEIMDGVCEPEYVAKPLKVGESRSYWLSTEGTRLIDLREAESWNSGDTIEIRLGAGFSRNGHYNAYVGMDVLRMRSGWHADKTIDFSDDPPKPFALDDHTVEIVRVVWGPNTKLVQGEILPIETEPVAHILVRLTRNR